MVEGKSTSGRVAAGPVAAGPVLRSSLRTLSQYVERYCSWTQGDFETGFKGPFLLVKSGSAEPVVVNLREIVAEGRSALTIGRSADCDIIVDDHAVSRVHARIHRSGDLWYFTDLGSSNGSHADKPLKAGRPLGLENGGEVFVGRRSLLTFYEAGSFYLMTYEDMKAARERLSVSSVIESRNSTQRLSEQRSYDGLLSARRDYPRSPAQIAQELGSASYHDFQGLFPFPVLFKLSEKAGIVEGDDRVRVLVEEAIATQGQSVGVSFWVLAGATSKDPVSIGRADGNQVVLPIASVARRHAAIVRTDNAWSIADLTEGGRLWVAGKKVHSPTLLLDSVEIRLGSKNRFQFMSPKAFWSFLKVFHQYPYSGQ